MNPRRSKSCARAAFAVAFIVAGVHSAPAADFYAGKTIDFVIGADIAAATTSMRA
jgi:hypothetical protein